MKYLEANGLFAPLVFSGNAHGASEKFFSFLQKKRIRLEPIFSIF